VCLVTGASSMVLDCVIERGNPADSELFERMLDRQEALYGHRSLALTEPFLVLLATP